MTIHYNTQENYLFATSLDQLQRMGVTISTGTDFEEYRRLLATARPDHVLGEPFEPTKNDLGEDNAIWLIGRDSAGKIVHTQAMKRLNLAHMRLSDYLLRNLKEFEPSFIDIDYTRSRYRPGPGAKRITGSVVYHGEFWIGGEKGQFRGTGLAPMLGRHAFLTALTRWQPDYSFGFVAKPLSYKGFAARFGYMHTEHNAIKYVLKGTGEVFEGMLGYMTKEDLYYVADTPIAEMLDEAA